MVNQLLSKYHKKVQRTIKEAFKKAKASELEKMRFLNDYSELSQDVLFKCCKKFCEKSDGYGMGYLKAMVNSEAKRHKSKRITGHPPKVRQCKYCGSPLKNGDCTGCGFDATESDIY